DIWLWQLQPTTAPKKHEPSHATSAHATSGAQKGCGGRRPGALLAPSSAAARWACAQHMLRPSDLQTMFERSACKARSELGCTTSPRAAQGSHAAGGTANIEARTAATTSRAPRSHDKAHQPPEGKSKTPTRPKTPRALINVSGVDR